MTPLAEAQAFVLSLVEPLAATVVPLREAAGLVLAEDVVALDAVPPFANTAMDGFALRSEDAAPGARLRVVGTVAAGAVYHGTVAKGEAVRIMTGAPVPDGADAVVIVERTTVDGNEVVLEMGATPGQHVRPAGDDIRPGDRVLAAGTTLNPASLGVLATVGRTEVAVIRRPRVGVMSTGDELVADGAPLGPGQIRDSNRIAVGAAAAAAGAEVVDLGLVRDDEAEIEAALAGGAERCDLVLSSGGVSMGDFDWVKVVLDRIGEMRWMQVAIRPAKPLAAGRVRSAAVIGLPGNPVSSLVSFELFARPAIRRLGGHATVERARIRATASDAFAAPPPGVTMFARVRLAQSADNTWTATSVVGQGSHHTAAMASADGLAVVEGPGIEAGDAVAVIPLG